MAKRGPKPPQSDAELTAAVRAVIAASPFHGEAAPQDLGALAGAGAAHVETSDVGRDARCRLARPCAAAHAGRRLVPHDGTIVTASPNVMWGTDATATVTALADGHVSDLRGDRSLHGRMCGTTRGEVRHALRGVGAGARRASEITSGRWPHGVAMRAHDAATTTAVST